MPRAGAMTALHRAAFGVAVVLALVATVQAHTTDMCFGLNSNNKVEIQVFHWHGCMAATGYVDVKKTQQSGAVETKRLHFNKNQCSNYRSHYETNGYACADASNNGNYKESFWGEVDFYCNGGDTFSLHAYSSPSWILVHSGDETFSCPSGGIKEPNEAPTDIAVSSSTIDENNGANAVVGSLSTTDPNNYDQNQHVYTILTSGSPFGISGSNSLVVKSANAMDYEAKSSYSVKVRSADLAGLTTDKTFTISVTNVNEAPTKLKVKMPDGAYPVVGGLPSPVIPEDAPLSGAGSSLATLEADDPDSGQSFTYSLQIDAGLFTLSGSTLKLRAPLNYEGNPNPTISVRVSDNGSPVKSTDFNIAVRVGNVNERPTDIALSSNTVLENQAVGTQIGTLSTTDPDASESFKYSLDNYKSEFNIDGNKLVTKVGFDFEAKSTYSLRIVTKDQNGNGLSYTKAFTIEIGDVDEPPVATNLVANVDEEMPIGTLVGQVTATQPGKPNLLLNFVLDPNNLPADNAFTVQACSGNIYTANVIDYETDIKSYSFKVNIQGDVDISADVTITINNVNEIPEPGNQAISVNENLGTGTVVLSSIPHGDPDAGQSHVYAIEQGDDNSVFAINTNSGQITVNNPTFLNFEARAGAPFDLVVSVSDGGLIGYADIKITVLDVNEPPNWAATTRVIAENSAVNTVIVPELVAFDEDGDDVTFTIKSGNTGNAFKLSSTRGSPKSRVDLEVAANVLNHENIGSYALEIEVSDPGGNKLTKTVTVSIADVNESPSISGVPTFSVDENTARGTVVGKLADYASDPDDGTTLVYTARTWTDEPTQNALNARGGLLVADDGVLTIGDPPDFERSTSYTIGVRVTDNAGLFVDQDITMEIDDVNEAPFIDAGHVRYIAENAEAGTDTTATASGGSGVICASDPEGGNSLTFSLVDGFPDEDHFKLAANSEDPGGKLWCTTIESKAGADFETNPKYTLKLRVSDGSLSFDEDVDVMLLDANDAPVLSDLTFAVGENSAGGQEVGAPIVASDQDVGDDMTFEIIGGNTGDAFRVEKLSSIVGRLKVVDGKNALQTYASSWSLTVRVTDEAGASDTATLSISLVPQNDPPDLAQTPSSVPLPENSDIGRVVFTAIATDPENDNVKWSIAAGNSASAFAINQADGRVTVAKSTALNFESDINVFTLTIQAVDVPSDPDTALTTSKEVTISLTDVNEAPTFPAPLAMDVDENVGANTLVSDSGNIQGVDVDAGDVLTYAITGGNVGSAFKIDADTGVLRTTGAAINYEERDDYVLLLKVTDKDGLSATSQIKVTVDDVNEAPSVSNAARSVHENLSEGTSVGAVIKATDPDAGQTFAWSIAGDSAFAIADDGQIYLTEPLNFEAATEHVLTVTVRDQGGLPDDATVTVTVLNTNEAPVFTEDADGEGVLSERSIKENSAKDTVVGSAIAASDVDAATTLTYSLHANEKNFRIDSVTGQVYLKDGKLDFETENRYSIDVTVTDNGIRDDQSAATKFTRSTLNINVVDVNERPWPTWGGTVFAVEENALNSVVETFTAADHDAGTEFDYKFASNNAQFSLSAEGVLKTKVELDFESKEFYKFDVTVCDNGVPANDQGTAEPLCATDSVTVNVTDVNEAPTIEDTSRDVEENSARLATVGDPIPSSDPDVGQLLLYSIESGNEARIFNINPCSGQIEVVKPVLNYEATNSYTLVLKVVDNGVPSLSDTSTLTINILDVNERPTIEPAALRVDENSPVDANVGGEITGADQDAGDVLSWSITEGNVGGVFKIESAQADGKKAQVKVAANLLDFERLHVYTLTIVAADDDDPALTASASVVVTIADVNEAPVVVLNGARSVPENSAGGTSLGAPIESTDVDADDGVTYSITGGDDPMPFGIDGDTGAMVTLASNTLNFEVKSSYSVEVTATDKRTPTRTGTAMLTVNLVDVNEKPSLSGAPAGVNVDENSPAGTEFGARIVGTDVDAGQILIYSIIQGNDAKIFRVDTVKEGSSKGEGQLVVAKSDSLDFETRTSYTVRVLVTDSGAGELSDQTDITITVDNINEHPRIPEHSVWVLENAAEGALVGNPVPSEDDDVGDTAAFSITTDESEVGADAFDIDSETGQISVSATGTPVLDFETNPRLKIAVTATDSGGLTATRDIWCQLHNVNEQPTMSDITMSVPERPDDDLPLAIGTITAADVDAPDGTELVYTMTSQSDAGVFSVGGDGVVYAVANPGTNTIVSERDASDPFTIAVQVSDSAFCCSNNDATDPKCCDQPPALTASATITITVTDANRSPILTDPSDPLTVLENQAADTVVGTIGFFDLDVADQTYTFSVRSPDDAYFKVSQQNVMNGATVTDVIPTIKTVRPLDYENKAVYAFLVDVIDSHATDPLGATLRVIVHVVDVNERPTIVLDTLTSSSGAPALSVDEDAVGQDVIGAGTLVGRLRFVDPDALGSVNATYENADFATLSWAISSPQGPLRIEAVGASDPFAANVVVDDADIDFEVTPRLDIEVTVTDVPGLSQTTAGVVKINNRNDLPANTDRAFTVHETAPVGTAVGSVPGTDEDVGTVPRYAIVAGVNMQHFKIDSLTAEITVASPDVDWESQNQYVLTINMTDSFVGEDPVQWTIQSTVTIDVINDNDITITGFSGAVPHSTVGGETVTIHGSDFGPKATAASTIVAVKYGAVDGTEFTATNCHVTGDSNTEITCDGGTATGSGSDLRWTVTVDGFTFTSGFDVTTSYKAPTITALSASVVDMATAGGTSVTVSGHDFGPEAAGYDRQVVVSYNAGGRRYVATDCAYTTGQDELPTQKLTCNSVPGVGTDITWQVAARKLVSAAFSADADGGGATPSRYSIPSVEAVGTDEALLTTHGGNVIVIAGQSFGEANMEDKHGLRVEYGPYVATNCRVTEPHTTITCTTAPGISHDHEVRVTVGGQISHAAGTPGAGTASVEDVSVTYQLPFIQFKDGVSGDGSENGGTKGNQNIVIKGDMFGTAAEVEARGGLLVTYGRTGVELHAERCHVAVDHIQINCETTEGTGSNHAWQVRIGGQWSPLNPANTSYASPIISFYTGPGTDQAITQGDQEVLIHGDNFGPDWLGNAITMTYQAKNGPTFTAEGCYIKENHTLIACKTAPGAGREHKWQALIDGLVSTTPTTNYAPPTITAIDGPGATSGSTYGGEQVNIHGTNFGPASMQDEFFEGVTYGPAGFGYTATMCKVISHTLITCRTAPGGGANMKWVVRVEGQQSSPDESPTTAYALPELTSSSLTSGPTDGGFEVTFEGKNLGLRDSSTEVVVEVTGIGGSRIIVYPIEIIAGGVKNSTVVHAGVPPGMVGPTDKVEQELDTVVFKFPEGRGMGKSMRLVVRPTGSTDNGVAFERKSDPITFDFDPPSVARVVTREEFASGGPTPDMAVTIHGSSFGAGPEATADSHVHLIATLLDPAGINVVDTIDLTVPKETPSAGLYYYELQSWDHNEIHFVVRLRGHVTLVLNSTDTSGVEHTFSTPIETYNFFSPTISNLVGEDGEQPTALPTDGSYTLTIRGRNLWSDGVNVSVTIGGTNNGVPCTEVAFGSLNTTGQPASAPSQWVSARLPPWTGRRVPVVVWKVFGNGVPEQGSAPQFVDFSAPFVRPLPGGTKYQAHTDGSTYIEVGGTSIGVQGAQLIFGSDYRASEGFPDLHAWDHSTCTQTQLTLRCQVPAGEGEVDPWSRTQADLYTLRARVPRLRCVDRPDAVTGTTPFDACVPEVDPDAAAYQLSPEDTVFFTYIAPSIQVASQQLDTAGGVITLWGRDLGVPLSRLAQPNVPTITLQRAGRTPLQCVPVQPMWLGVDSTPGTPEDRRETLRCTLESGVGAGWTVVMTLAGLRSTATVDIDFAPPVLDELPFAARNGTTDGGYTVAVTGSNFGSDRYESRVRVEIRDRFVEDAPVETPAITTLTHTLFEFAMPVGLGYKTFTLVVDGQASNAVDFQYNAPAIDDLYPRVINTNGGRDEEMTIVGSSLGVEFGVVEIYSPPLSKTYNFTADGVLTQVTDTQPARWYNCSSQPAVCVQEDGGAVPGCDCRLSRQEHNEYRLVPPGGMGQDLSLRVFVGFGEAAMVSNTVGFAYGLPDIDIVIPTPADSEGDDIKIYGSNFGGVASTVVVALAGVECKDAAWVKDKSNRGEPYLRCRSARHVVGGKNVTLGVAFQDAEISFHDSFMVTECKTNFYGQEGEWCLPCPQGASCAGKTAEPLAIEGWFNMNGSHAEGHCHEDRAHRPYCNYLVPCEPSWACLAENVCADGYVSKAPTLRCAECDVGYYRLAGECIECPDNPLFLIIGFIIGALLACVAGYFLNSKSVNLAFVSIGVDYFQVLAMFRNSRVQWPQILKDLFHLMSVFNFNLEITAPECSIPDLGYVTKWFFIEALPIEAGCLMVIAYIALYINKRVCRGRKKKLHTHAPAMIGTALVLFYYMYLYLTRTVLDVFNCAPTQPPDGKEYLEVVFEECGLEGGIQMTLLPFAALAMLFYVLGYPALVAWTLTRNKLLIMEDQLLRAKDQGASRVENRNAYDVRKKYSKMYYHFRPVYWYWILVVIARKFGIAFTSLMFNKNPAFQLSMALLVLFVAYALQVKNSPFMSMSERTEVIRDHQQRVKDGDSVHMRLAATLGAIAEKKKKRGRRFSWGASGMVLEMDVAAAGRYFFSYNTVEATLLFCAVLVCLAGVMFESNRFDSAYFETQKLIIVICVLIVIFFSIVYFMTVMASEVYSTLCTKVTKLDKSGRAKVRQSNGKQLEGVQLTRKKLSGGGEAGLNPLFAGGGGDSGGSPAENEARAKAALKGGVPDPATWRVIKSEVARIQAANEDMAAEFAEMKRKQQTTGMSAAEAYRKPNAGRTGRARKEFAPQHARRGSVKRGKRRPKPGGADGTVLPARTEATPFQ